SCGYGAAFRHLLNDQHRVEERAVLPTKDSWHGHAEKTGILERFYNVPGILRVSIDGGRAWACNIAGKCTRAVPQRHLVLGKAWVHCSNHNAVEKPMRTRFSLQVNQPLGLTFYCSRYGAEDPRRATSRVRCRGCHARLIGGRLLQYCLPRYDWFDSLGPCHPG